MNMTLWPLAGCLLAVSAYAQAADPNTVYGKGGANPAAIACATCHGAEGEGMAAAGFPRLAGLSGKYLRKQLNDFASGKRVNPIMQPIAAALTAAESDAVTTMLSDKPQPQVKRSDRTALMEGLGGILAQYGAWDRNIPACVACHGPNGVGVGDSFPQLAGQSAQYLASQLTAWQNGTRKNDPNDLMGHIARNLTEGEIKAVSAYFVSLTDTGEAK